jgi:hypothetical protein
LKPTGRCATAKVLQRRLVAVGAFGPWNATLISCAASAALVCSASCCRRTESSRISRKMRRTNAGSSPSRSPTPIDAAAAPFRDRVAHRAVAVGLHSGDLPRQPRPLAERRHQHRIDVVETLP